MSKSQQHTACVCLEVMKGETKIKKVLIRLYFGGALSPATHLTPLSHWVSFWWCTTTSNILHTFK